MLKETLFSARLLPSIKECLRIVYADIEKDKTKEGTRREEKER